MDKATVSVTRRLVYFYNIWPFTTKKIGLSRLKFLKIAKENPKKLPMWPNFAKSGRTGPVIIKWVVIGSHTDRGIRTLNVFCY